jgi:hypothetical protein
MGRECFCGCGRSIPIRRVRLRAHDSRGREILDHVRSVPALASGESEDPHLARWCAKGEMLVAMMAEVVHRERDPWSIDDGEIRIWLMEGTLMRRDLVVERREAGDHTPPSAYDDATDHG